MGRFVNPRATQTIAWLVVAAIVALNAALVVITISG
jgi:manganese transport protein